MAISHIIMAYIYCISKKFLQGFYFCEFRELNLKRENRNSPNMFPSFINERKVCTTNDTQIEV